MSKGYTTQLIPSLQENLQHFYDMLLYRGGSRIFLRRGCTTNLTDDVKNFKSEYEEEGFWLGNNNVNCWEYISNDRADFAWLWSDCTVLIKKPQVTPEEGVRTPCTLPLDPPLLYFFKLFINTILVLFGEGREGGGTDFKGVFNLLDPQSLGLKMT